MEGRDQGAHGLKWQLIHIPDAQQHGLAFRLGGLGGSGDQIGYIDRRHATVCHADVGVFERDAGGFDKAVGAVETVESALCRTPRLAIGGVAEPVTNRLGGCAEDTVGIAAVELNHQRALVPRQVAETVQCGRAIRRVLGEQQDALAVPPGRHAVEGDISRLDEG